jgi:hypothetical protein
MCLFRPFQIVYSYGRLAFLIAYGFSIIFAALAVTAGMMTIIMNGTSFSNDFSTILRVRRSAGLSMEVKDGDTTKSDPLPRYLKHACIGVGPSTATRQMTEKADISVNELSLVDDLRD